MLILSFSYWNHREPNNLGNEDCVEVGHYGGRKWNDIKCSHKYFYVCQLKTKAPAKPNFTKRCFLGKCYWYSPNKLSHRDAAKNCASRGLELVQIKNHKENVNCFFSKYFANIIKTHIFSLLNLATCVQNCGIIKSTTILD